MTSVRLKSNNPSVHLVKNGRTIRQFPDLYFSSRSSIEEDIYPSVHNPLLKTSCQEQMLCWRRKKKLPTLLDFRDRKKPAGGAEGPMRCRCPLQQQSSQQILWAEDEPDPFLGRRRAQHQHTGWWWDSAWRASDRGPPKTFPVLELFTAAPLAR